MGWRSAQPPHAVTSREATTETIPMEEVEPVVQVKPEVEKVEEKKVEELKVG